MLCLLGVLLCCTLCLTTPVPRAAGTGCAASSLILETLIEVQVLRSKGSSRITALNNVMEEGGDVTTYLEVFIKALKSSEERSKERLSEEMLAERLIAQKLQKIKDDGKSCRQWMEQDWEPVKEKDFLGNLEYLLRFLNHNTPLEATA